MPYAVYVLFAPRLGRSCLLGVVSLLLTLVPVILVDRMLYGTWTVQPPPSRALSATHLCPPVAGVPYGSRSRHMHVGRGLSVDPSVPCQQRSVCRSLYETQGCQGWAAAV